MRTTFAFPEDALFLIVVAAITVGLAGHLGAGEKVVAKVDGVPVYQSEVDRELDRLIARWRSFPPDQAEEMRRQAERRIVEDLIGKLLLVNVARASGLEVTEAEIAERLALVMKTIAPGGSPDSLLDEAGISKEQLAEDVRRNLLIQKLIDAKTKDIAPPSDEQLTAFYEDNKERFFQPEMVECRHIFLDTEGLTDAAQIEAKREQAVALRRMLLENPGLDFARIAREKSEEPSAANGGYLGFMGKSDFLPEFTSAAFAQEVGKIGEVVRTQIGFHLIKVESRTEARQPPLPEIRDQVRDGMLQRKRAEVMKKYVDEWRRAAKIELVTPVEEASPPSGGEKPKD